MDGGGIMSAAGGTVNVIAILPSPEDQSSLKEIFRHSKWNLQHVEALGHARLSIDEPSAGVVISDERLPDGSWRDVLGELRCRSVEPLLIVVSRLADERLWADVLNRGGFDVLATPFEAQEVTRSVSLAWQQWRHKLAHTKERSMRAGSSGWQV
jgi:DNA-binding NtrC family response regulator